MTGLVRKATLLAVCGLLAASSALAFVPDPHTSTVPNWIFAVEFFNNGNPDVVGAAGPAPQQSNKIVIRDFAGNPVSGVGVTICPPCDIHLENVVPPLIATPSGTLTGQTVNCTTNCIRGITDAGGNFIFALMGAGDDPGHVIPNVSGTQCNVPPPPSPAVCQGVWRGGGANSTDIIVDGYSGSFSVDHLRHWSTVAVDQNSASGLPHPAGDVSFADAAVVVTLVGAYNANPAQGYKARGDYTCDGTITFGDVAGLTVAAIPGCLPGACGHIGRVAIGGGYRTTDPYCAKVTAACR